jgi:hypothetical protein
MKTGPRRANEPKIIGVGEACEIIGCRPQNIGQIVGLPEPYDHCRATTLYREEEIKTFADTRNAKRHPAAA